MKPPGEKRRILIADDVRSVSSLMVSVLGARGFEVEAVTDGEQCLARTETFRPHLVVVDIMMPKVHGVEVLRRLKASEETRSIGIIICTAKAYKPDMDQAFELGAFGILPKPFTPAALVDLVERFFAGADSVSTHTASQTSGELFLPPDPTGPRFCTWGTRGSIPVSGGRFVRHGGNTSCLEVASGNDLLIVDAGSGIRELGLELARQGPRTIHLFISHTHWDHIQGFPFFPPAYIPGFELHVYGARGFKKDLHSVFRGQLDPDYFPVQFEDMRASTTFHALDTPPLQVGPFSVSWEYTHHPAATLGFKITVAGRTVAYVSDNEFMHGYLGSPHGVTMSSEPLLTHRPLVEFLQGVDVLIGEAQYTNQEYRTKVGWGHSSVSNACVLAALAKPKRWFVTHHDPLHDDEFLENKLSVTRELIRSMGCATEVRHAYDGMTEFI